MPPEVAARVSRRSFTVAAGVQIDDVEAQGALFADGGVGGGHALFLEDGRLHHVNNWVGEHEQKTSSDGEVPTGRRLLTAEFQKTGEDPGTKSALGTLTLSIDNEAVGSAEIKTQPGRFTLAGDGLAVGRDTGSPVSRDDGTGTGFPFRGGTIDRVVVDVGGEEFVDHDEEVRRRLLGD